MPADTASSPAPAAEHRPFEDAQGIAFGTAMAGFGIVILTHLGFITGQTAGLAVLISYLTGWHFGWVFFVVNLPFYWLGWKRMGVVFTLKTFASVALLSIFAAAFPRLVSFSEINPVFGAILFGCVTGAGLLALFRHGASLGGVGILALWLQERTGFRAGLTQLTFDACLFGIAFFLLDWGIVLYSLLGAVVVNLVIAINHRRDWYIAR